MSWITKERADEYLSLDKAWNDFDDAKKNTLLEQSSNRLEQLTFKDEDENRVGVRYSDGESTTKVASVDEFLLKATNGNFAYHAALGWTRTEPNMDLLIYTPTTEDTKATVFDVPDIDNKGYSYGQLLTFKQMQSLHTFGGKFGGNIALGVLDGEDGNFTTIQCKQSTSIVDKEGEPVFATHPIRRLNASFTHNGANVVLRNFEGTTGVSFNGVNTVDVIDVQGNEVSNTVPLVLPGDYFTYEFEVFNGLNKTMFLSINDILVGNPTFSAGGQAFNRLLYGVFTGASVRGHTYIKEFGSIINVENPTTIPLRLVGACSLLALEYGKFPLNYTGDKEYLENENDYNRMQDLPINVQAAVEPFLADYRETENVVNPDEVDRERTYHATALEYK